MNKLTMCLLIAATLALGACNQKNSENEARLEVANQMVQAWNERNWERVYELFAQDGVLHSVMKEPVVGRDNIRERLAGLLAGIEEIELRIVNMGVVNDVVVLERVDDFIFNGKRGSVPVVGVMEITNGEITLWREYYDHHTLAEALIPEPRPPAEIQAEAEGEIRALIEKLETDWNSGDMSAYLDAYWNSEELSLLFQDKSIRGWQALSELFTGTWTTEEEMGDFRTLAVAIRFPAPDMAIASGGFEHQFPEEKVVGAFTHVLRRSDDGGWLIVHEHTSRGLTH
jgi:limonene-1,2-epoxide hydrolase